MKGCGTCTACCTIMRVTMEPPKPEWTPCKHLCRKGCGIYPDRPKVCRGFDCGWLITQRLENPWPKELRPDKCGAVLEVNTHGNLVVHCRERGRPWEREPLFSALTAILDPPKTRVIITTDQAVYALLKSGSVAPLRMIGVDPTSDECEYVLA